ncbi:sulfatase-like hydrolase/transferase [Bremerella sp.]|uniref:sulfatase-like hydrolase/transferase n=1 Tax=Bremerella sp. TaxID=2795602 RepID=UPI00391D8CF1
MKQLSILMVFALSAVFVASSAFGDDELEMVKYRNPGLKVDLGVGLWAWPMPIDWDDDGDIDLVVSCPDVPFNGMYLFENPGDDAKFPTFKPPVKIGPGMHSVHVSYVDGRPRVLSPGTEWVDFLGGQFKENKSIYTTKNVHPNRVRANQWRYVDYDNDGATDLLIGVGDWTEYGWDDAFDADGNWTRGPLHGYVYLVRNTGTTQKPTYAEPTRLEAGGQLVDVFGMPSPNLADFDGDGDLDLLCGEFLDGFTYFQNIGSRERPKFASGKRLSHEGQPLAMDLQMITPTAFDWDRDGDWDLVVGDEDGRVALVENTGKVVDGLPQFLPPKYFQQEADALKFGALATPVGVDWDGDGDEDIITGNSAGYIAFFENMDGGNPPKWADAKLLKVNGKPIRPQAGPNGSIQGPAEAKWGYTTLSVADWDHDGKNDLMVNSIWGKIEWYRNTGALDELAEAQPVEVEWQGTPPHPAWNWWKPEGKQLATQWRTTPVVIDLDKDGLNDLVCLDHEGYLAWFRREKVGAKLVLRPGKRVFTDRRGEPLQLNAKTAGGSGRRKICIADWDGDGKLDLLLNSRSIDLMRNVSTKDKPWAFDAPVQVHPHRLAGHTTSPTVVDWNRDNRPDLFVGAEDGHFYHLENNWQPFEEKQVGPLTIERKVIALHPFGNGEKAYGNRPYVWDDVPERLEGWQFLRGNGGEADPAFVTASRDATVYLAISASVKPADLPEWNLVEGETFHYTDGGRTLMRVYQCDLSAGDRIAIPQLTWTGGMLLLPPTTKSSKEVSKQSAVGRTNVLFIAVDDLRVQLGCYGDSIAKTPNIDALADRGMLFQRAYCQQALCNPSRASVMTGQYPDTLGIWNLVTHFRETQPDVVTLPERFKNEGYYTQNIGKIYHNYRQNIQNDEQSWSVPARYSWGAHSNDWYVEGEPFEMHKVPKGPSFQKVEVPDEAYLDGRIAKAAVETIRQRAHERQPFFLAVGFWKPHLPFNAPKRYWDQYDVNEIAQHIENLPTSNAPEIARHDSREVRSYTDIPRNGDISFEQNLKLSHGYYAAISFLDAQIGKVLDELQEQGLADNTIVVFWSDHGLHLGEHDLWCKTSNFELDARVPLIISQPGMANAGEQSRSLVELVDMYPTLLQLCGLSAPLSVEGKSLVPVLENPGVNVRSGALTQHPRPAYYQGKPDVMGYSLRTNEFRYTEWRDFMTGKVNAVELYDHRTDPEESTNVADGSNYASVRHALSEQLAIRITRSK